MIEEQIKPSELRIGNYVKTDLKDSDFDNNIYQIETIANEFPTLNTVEFGIGVIDWNNIKPIPLTEEWLVKFGFKEESLSQFILIWQDNDNCNSCFMYSDFCTISVNHTYFDNSKDDYVVHNEIKYVHQLQNLFFCLCGEELVINK